MFTYRAGQHIAHLQAEYDANRTAQETIIAQRRMAQAQATAPHTIDELHQRLEKGDA